MPRETGRSMANMGASEGQPGAVGGVLAAERKRRGESLEHVSETLRIRQPYLEAIEADRIDDLPGRAYALGFVRAYAEHLGLDGEEIMRRFKAGAAGLDKRTELVFPSPVSEGRFPGRMALAISVAAAIVIYGVWHQMASQDRSVAEQVPPVPAQMAEPAPKEGEKAEGEVKEQGEAVSKPDGEAKPAETAAAPAGAPAPPPSAPAATPPTASPAPAATPAPAAAPQSAPPPQTTAPAQTAGATAPKAAPSVTATPAPQPAPPPQTTGPAQTPAPPPTAAVPPAALGAGVYGAEGPVRVVMRAVSESWIQVQDSKGAIVAMRVLKPGESFRVPNMAGLTLYTGNAGGLEVTVDGRAAPALGAPGSVRRNIPLDPEKLMAGG